jgi:hypothetical protein
MAQATTVWKLIARSTIQNGLVHSEPVGAITRGNWREFLPAS